MRELSHWFLAGDLRWALLLIPVALGIFFREVRGGYLQKMYARPAHDPAKIRLRGALPGCFALAGLIVTVAALMDFTRGYAVVEEHLTVNRIIVSVDNSSSMYNFKYTDSTSGNIVPIHCADKNLQEEYPRIYGACVALYRLIDATEAHAKRKGDTEKDHIALTRFALNSYVVSALTGDYALLRGIIKGWDWREQYAHNAQDIHTEIHLALWGLYSLALDRNRSPDSGFTYLSFEDMALLWRALRTEDGQPPFSLPFRFKDTRGKDGKPVPGLASRLKEELRDTAFIIITDANIGQLERRIDSAPISLRKMLEFAGLIELPVYFVSTDEANEIYKRMARKTGFVMGGKDYRGDFLVANRDLGYAHLETLVSNILSVRFARTIPVRAERRISYAAPLAFLALTCFGLGIFFRETTSRSLTNV